MAITVSLLGSGQEEQVWLRCILLLTHSTFTVEEECCYSLLQKLHNLAIIYRITPSGPTWIKACHWLHIKGLCCEQEHLILTHTSQSMADSSNNQTWPVLTFLETRQWSFFHSPFFSFFLSLTGTETALENFFHTVPVHSNEPIVSENIQHSSSDTEGSREQLWKTGPWLLHCSCTRLWNVVCRLHQGFAKRPLFRPTMHAQRGYKITAWT